MPTATFAPPAPGPWTAVVPWERADDLRAKLRKRGYPATLCLDPEARVARLELWPGVPAGPAAEVLGELLVTRPAPRSLA